MDWTDEGIVLGVRKHGETSAVVQLLTREHGRHAGLVRGGDGSKARGIYQPGNLVAAHWRARLAEHLGAYTCEPLRSHSAAYLDDPLRLAALASACAVAETSLPERQPHPAVYDAFGALIEALADTPDWGAVYVRWELGLLDEIGYGLDLSSCAATGTTDDLVYVSPKSGRAVSRGAGAPYHDRLFALPAFLTGNGGGSDPEGIVAGLRLTGGFLDRHVFAAHNRRPPAARDRFVARFNRTTTTSSDIRAE